jgi:hypothetical protein
MKAEDIKIYVDQFGDKLIQDVTEKILKNKWVRSGTLLNSLEFGTETFRNSIKGELFIQDYYQYLVDGRRKAPKVEASTPRVTANTGRISQQTQTRGIEVPSNKTTFVTPLINQNITFFEREIVPQIEKDITKLITDKINSIK